MQSRSRTSVTASYLLGLFLVALVLVGSHMSTVRRLSSNRDDGHVINVAGQQRMLSQRIALLAREAVRAPSDEVAGTYVDKLRWAVNRMAENHAELNARQVAEATDESVLAHYRGPKGINERTARFLADAERCIVLLSEGRRREPATEANVESIASIARNGYLYELDAAVQAYQVQFEADIAHFERLGLLVMAVGLLLLVAEALFIFRPMAAAIQRTLNSLEGANDELRQFSFRISHDLRAPIASSLGMVSLAQESNDENDPEETRFALEQVDQSLARMDGLIEDVVEVIRCSMEELAPEPVSVQDVVQDAAKKLTGMAGFEHIDLSFSFEIDGPVLAKRHNLEQIVENLLSNAVKYSDSSRAQRTIHVATSWASGQAQIAVSDNGVGISPEFREQLFGMFKRFHEGQSFGSGLGLYLVKQNARALGGDITYEPLDEGSKFTLTWVAPKEPVHA